MENEIGNENVRIHEYMELNVSCLRFVLVAFAWPKRKCTS
jgi:hypothetical protein